MTNDIASFVLLVLGIGIGYNLQALKLRTNNPENQL